MRAPKWKDLDDFVDLINSLVEEGAPIILEKKVTREEEADWLSKVLARMEKGEQVWVSAEVDGSIVGNSSLSIKGGCRSHTGDVGVILKEGYRDVGIGTEMMRTLIEHANKKGLKVLTLGVFATNKRAYHVYEKVGFENVGCIPKGFYRNGKYIDHILMAMEL